MGSIYDIFEHIEKRPAMYLGNDYGIAALNCFVTGFRFGGGEFYSRKLNYPNFNLFTEWLGGVLKYKYENSSVSWSGLLLEKYKDDRKALEKFFYYLNRFKTSESEVAVVPLKNENIEFALQNKTGYLWCKVGNVSKSYYDNVKKIDKLILFKLNPSKTLFLLIIDKNSKIIDDRNIDMTDKILRSKIEKQFGINLIKLKMSNSVSNKNILREYKII